MNKIVHNVKKAFLNNKIKLIIVIREKAANWHNFYHQRYRSRLHILFT